MSRHALAATALGLVVASSGHRAAAQPTSKGAAIALFDDGVALMQQGKYAEACPKLAQSQQLAPTGGTLLALGDCYKANGQFASSWVAYKEAAGRARSAGKSQAEHRALDAAAKIEPDLVWVKINVPATPEGTAVTRNGETVPPAEWGVASPLDPGRYRIDAAAPGHRRWSTDIVVGARGERMTIDVPALERDLAAADPAPSGAGTQPAAGSSSAETSVQRFVAYGVAGAGVLGMGIGAVFGLVASSKNDDAAAQCRTENLCSAEGLRLDEEARSAATVSTVTFILGSAALASGIVLYVTAPDVRARSKTTLGVGLGTRRGLGVNLTTRF